MHVTNMMIEARDWVRSHFPWWDRRGGADHIWLMNHDEGAWWVLGMCDLLAARWCDVPCDVGGKVRWLV